MHLILTAGANVKRHTIEVQAAVVISQWCFIQKHRASIVFQTDDFAFADEIEDTSVSRALQAVWRLHGGPRLGAATFAASENEVSHGFPSGEIKPAQGGLDERR
nr:hypothetical protein [Pseudomonas atacamensis]